MVLRTGREPERGLYLAESEKVIRRALRGRAPARGRYLMAPRWLTDLADLVDGRRARRRAGLRRRAPTCSRRSPGSTCTAGRSRRCTGPTCPRSRRCWPVPAGSRSSRTSSTTPTSARSSATAPRSASTRCWSLRGVPTRCTGAASGSRWARCSRCRGRASTPGPVGWRCCGTTASVSQPSRSPTTPSAWTTLPPSRRSGWPSCSAPRGTACRGAPSRRADLVVRIPMAGGVDSLNVAAASAVALWALRPPQR